ncbi:MAG: nuclear transport factor 2 family protein [Solirubrobacteraceae bacterium]
MSEEGLQVVGELLAVHDGKSVLPSIEETLKSLSPEPSTEAAGTEAARTEAARVLGEDDAWKLCSPEIVWDMTPTGLGVVAHGASELFQWWSTWIAAWSSYEYSVKDTQDLGEWVLTKGDVVVTARNGQAVEMPVWQLWKVADGRVTVMRGFLTEADARAAAAA